MSTIAESGVVTMRCAARDCTNWQTADARHLANLLAGGPWHCPEHKRVCDQ